MKKVQQGFTLIELMIVIAIIGILAAIALPAYQQYTMKARFSEVVMATSSVKTAMELCAQTKGGIGLGLCVPSTDSDVTAAEAGAASGVQVTSVAAADTGIITATPAASNGFLVTDLYTLTPTFANGAITWAKGGACVTKGYC